MRKIGKSYFAIYEEILTTVIPEINAATEALLEKKTELNVQCDLGKKASLIYATNTVGVSMMRSMRALAQIVEALSVLYNVSHQLRTTVRENEIGETAEDVILRLRGVLGNNSEHPAFAGMSFDRKRIERETKGIIMDWDARMAEASAMQEDLTLKDLAKFKEWIQKNKPEILDSTGAAASTPIPPFVPGGTA